MKRTKELDTVAAAALAWGRARRARIAVSKVAFRYALFSRLHPQRAEVERAFDAARKAESQARAALVKACAAADPAPVVVDVVASGVAPAVPVIADAAQLVADVVAIAWNKEGQRHD
jgi:hypothetical protein